MAEILLNIRRFWRKRLLIAISAFWYVMCILALMGWFPIAAEAGGLMFVLRVTFLLLLLFFRTFACIDLQHIRPRIMLLRAASLFILSTLLFGGDNLMLLFLQKVSNSSGLWSVIEWNEMGTGRRVFVSACLHIVLVYRWYSKKNALHNTRSFSLRGYLYEGTGMLIILCAASSAWFLLVQFQQLPFACSDLEKQSLVGVDMLWGIQDTIFRSEPSEVPWKTSWFSQIFDERKNINQWICEYIITQINEKYQNPAFQYSVAVLLTLLLTPFLTLIRMTFQIIQLLLFRGSELTWVYRREPVLQRVEEMR